MMNCFILGVFLAVLFRLGLIDWNQHLLTNVRKEKEEEMIRLEKFKRDG